MAEGGLFRAASGRRIGLGSRLGVVAVQARVGLAVRVLAAARITELMAPAEARTLPPALLEAPLCVNISKSAEKQLENSR